MQCGNNLKQLGVGFHNFDTANGGFPPRRWNRNADATEKEGMVIPAGARFCCPSSSSRICTTPITGTTTSSTPSIKRSWKPSFRCPFVPAPQEKRGNTSLASAASADRRIPTRARRTRSRDGSIISRPTAYHPQGPATCWIKDFPGYTSANTTSNAHQAMLASCPGQRGLPTS